MNNIIGTILSSTLDYDNLTKISEDPKVIDPIASKWIPADGRSIKGSLLHRKTGQENAPDLRGKFLRGLNILYNTGQPTLELEMADPDGANRKPGDYQEDQFKNHAHSYILSNTQNNADDGTTRSYRGSDAPGAMTGTVGGKETRPRNVAVFFYIKIN
ncbi:MAG TPA: hypothetical protein VK826_19235 [Bacteroidia bacterium]|nr:hypothetical protein [Bacteroidia bacterium]